MSAAPFSQSLTLASLAERSFFSRLNNCGALDTPASSYKDIYGFQEADDPLLNCRVLNEDFAFSTGVESAYHPLNQLNHAYRGYAEDLQNAIILPKPQALNKRLDQTLFRRRSQRSFDKERVLNFKQLSTLLYYSAGSNAWIERRLELEGEEHQIQEERRSYPSAGALYPLHVYLLLQNSSLAVPERQLYRYQPLSHSLLALEGKLDLKDEVLEVDQAQCLIFLAAQLWRTRSKYGRFTLPFVLLEAGALMQNFYLVSNSLALGCCSWGSFPQTRCESAFQLDGLSEQMLHCLCLGHTDD